jgi:streptogramin lyase
MKRRYGIGLTGLVLVMLAAAAGGAASGTARADYAPVGSDAGGDVVGVSASPQGIGLDFANDGDYLGDVGYDGAGNQWKAVSFDATADANQRTAYQNGSSLASPQPLDPTAVLRGGTFPVQRPQSSNAALSALLADTSLVAPYIDYVVTTSLPGPGPQATAITNGWDGLRVVQIATDAISIAVDATSTNAPAGLSVAELDGIYSGTYQYWNQLPGNAGGSADAIIPELPPRGSGIYHLFMTDIGNPSLGSDVQFVNENDPAAITGAASPADAIVPFSSALASLYASDYFPDPQSAYPGTLPASSPIQVLAPGVIAPDGSLNYQGVHGVYVVFRQSDATSQTPWQPGSTENWAQALFIYNGTVAPYYATPAAQADLLAAGLVPDYVDLLTQSQPLYQNFEIGAIAPQPVAAKNIVLVAGGDSVTSAFNQAGFGIPTARVPCPATTANAARLVGNDTHFSYANQYYLATPAVTQYWNFARPGYGTNSMIGPAVAGDSCGNQWPLAQTPAAAAANVIAAGKANGYQAYYVATGGVNDTNWADVVGGLATCEVYQWEAGQLAADKAYTVTMTWTPAEANVVPGGGSCTLAATVNATGRPVLGFPLTAQIPFYNGVAGVPCAGGTQLSCSGANVTQIVNAELAAGADKAVWMQYYDITLGDIDAANIFNAALANRLGIPLRAVPPSLIPLIDPVLQPVVKSLINEVNVAIFTGLNQTTASSKVKMGYPGVDSSADIQDTGAGGAPHPSMTGQQGMAQQLTDVYDELPVAAKPGVAGAISEYSLPAGSGPTSIAYGPDANLWVSEAGSGRIGLVNVNGDSAQLFLPQANNVVAGGQNPVNPVPSGIVTGPDNNVWVADFGSGDLTRITPAGTTTEIPLGNVPNPGPAGVAAGPDGNVWVTEQKAGTVVSVLPGGGIKNIVVLPPGSLPESIVTGPDGNLWVTEPGTDQVAAISPAGFILGQVNLPPGANPSGIASVPGSELYVTEPGIDSVAAISTRGIILGQIPLPPGSEPTGITFGPDLNLWVTEPGINSVAKLPFGAGPVQFGLPTPNADPTGIAGGSDGNLWVTENAVDQLAVIKP